MFKKYDSIENSYNRKWINSFAPEAFNQEFLVTEKLHGVNFQFHYDGKELKVGKRTNYVEGGEKFYNYEIVLEKYSDSIKRMYDVVGEFILYGELYGGNSRGDIRSKYSQVQKGVFYTPEIEFLAFDLFVVSTGEYLTGCQFVDFVPSYCDIVPIIGVYKFADALELDTKFDSKIGGIADNISEGVVIRPWNFDYKNYHGERLIIKKKNEEFKENCRAKKEVVQLDINSELMERVISYINRNRLESVLSKIGEVSIKEFGLVMKEFSKDIHDDFLKENDVDMDEWKVVWKSVQKVISTEIRNYFYA
jgi:Rnl2 family RNA ligase